MDKAKIRLSPLEAELVSNTLWILTKNEVMRKAKLILEDVAERQRIFLQQNPDLLPQEIISIPPKISKGEYYKGLPYYMLDHPRQLSRDGNLAIRTMFWWGNFFSVTLHISQHHKDEREERIISMLPDLRDEFFICVNEDEWEHDFDPENYRRLSDMEESQAAEIVRNKSFLKLSKQIPISEWEKADDLIFETFSKLLVLMKG